MYYAAAFSKKRRPSTAAALSAFTTSALCSDIAFAGPAPTPDIADTLCSIASFCQGDFGQSLAIIAVMALGSGALFGKVSWGLAITVAVGIFIVFTGGDLVHVLLDTANPCSAESVT